MKEHRETKGTKRRKDAGRQVSENNKSQDRNRLTRCGTTSHEGGGSLLGSFDDPRTKTSKGRQTKR